LQIAGRLFKHNSNTQQAQARLKETAVQWYYSQMGASSAFTTTQYKVSAKVNPYKKLFKAGASLIPRCFYFVDVPSVRIPFKPDDIVPIKTNKQMQLQAKPPWKGLGFGSKLVEGKYLFHTATSNSLLPFALHEPLLVALPIEITQNEDGIKKINLLSVDDIMLKGDTHTGMWFYAAENIWAIHRTQRNRKIDAINYANWQNKLTAQNLNAPYLVMYNKSAKDANATIAMREQFFTEFLAEGGTFVYYTYIIEEAYYLTAILNAPTPNLLMKDFQTKGLWGYRDVAKKILDVYFPKFDKKDNIHVELATLSKLCHDKTAVFLKSQTIHRFLDTRALGTLRSQIKAMLKNELEAIDKLVKQIIA
ncbi:MAG: hypothetical protein EBX41_05260, partial [Chitinophagia bacterium]|nr:hypothetical protein [Chitinophagia bacterium]